MRVCLSAAVFGVVAMLWAHSPARGDVTIEEKEFSITLPEGWVEIPGHVLAAMHAELQRQSKSGQIPKYDYGYQREAEHWLAYPYVLVQVDYSGRPAERDLKGMPKFDFSDRIEQEASNYRAIVSELKVGQMQYDDKNQVIWMRVEMDVAGVGPVNGISGFLPTQKGMIFVHAYARRGDFGKELGSFREIILSTQPSPELAYQPRWTEQIPVAGGFNVGAMLLTTLVGSVVGGIAAVVMLLFRNKKPAA